MVASGEEIILGTKGRIVMGASFRALLTNRSRLAPPSRVVSDEKGWWEGDDDPEEEYEGSISWKLNVSKLIQLLPFVATAIWIIVEIL